jgi:hypothetical protein
VLEDSKLMEATPTTSEAREASPTGHLATPSTPFDTTEVRWFASGPMPRPLVNWFTLSGTRGTLEVRYDAYLAGTSSGLGRKRRNRGPLETKTRLGVGAKVSLDDRLDGHLEEWRKVITTTSPPPTPTDLWAEVHKVLLTRTYHASVRDAVVEVAYGDLSAPGCDIELAAVAVEGVAAWTFALEAWGPPALRSSLLQHSANVFVAETGLPASVTSSLTVDMGYPEWLAQTVWRDHHMPG